MGKCWKGSLKVKYCVHEYISFRLLFYGCSVDRIVFEKLIYFWGGGWFCKLAACCALELKADVLVYIVTIFGLWFRQWSRRYPPYQLSGTIPGLKFGARLHS